MLHEYFPLLDRAIRNTRSSMEILRCAARALLTAHAGRPQQKRPKGLQHAPKEGRETHAIIIPSAISASRRWRDEVTFGASRSDAADNLEEKSAFEPKHMRKLFDGNADLGVQIRHTALELPTALHRVSRFASANSDSEVIALDRPSCGYDPTMRKTLSAPERMFPLRFVTGPWPTSRVERVDIPASRVPIVPA